MSGREHVDALEHGGWFRDIAETEVGVDGAGAAACGDVAALEDAFGFAGEEEAAVGVVIVERLLAGAVAGDERVTRAFVAEAEGEHAIEA